MTPAVSSVVETQTADQSSIPSGLDQNLNHLMPNNPSARPDERAVEACAPLRSVDWRGEPQPMENYHHRLAAHGQRCGEAAPPGEECSYCKRGLGGFSACVVNYSGDKMFTGNFTKEWVTNYVANKTSPHDELTVEKDNEASTNQNSGTDFDTELWARLRGDNPFPPAPDGGPGWNQDLYRSPLFPPDGLDAESQSPEIP
ncbi:hypothetical protein PoHVEF18_000475 [Penicillium ochrochloron]